jgi:hypothetical protein
MAELMDGLLHLRYQGRSEELPLATLSLAQSSSDAEIKEAVARHLDATPQELESYVVVRTSKVVIVRPEALYG